MEIWLVRSANLKRFANFMSTGLVGYQRKQKDLQTFHMNMVECVEISSENPLYQL